MDVPCAGAQIVGMKAKLDDQLDELYRVADPVIKVNKCADAHKNANVHFLSDVARTTGTDAFMPLSACNFAQVCYSPEGPAEGHLEDTVVQARL